MTRTCISSLSHWPSSKEIRGVRGKSLTGKPLTKRSTSNSLAEYAEARWIPVFTIMTALTKWPFLDGEEDYSGGMLNYTLAVVWPEDLTNNN
jgi:hypothetical protein